MTKYINPYTDFGFKKLFGEEGSKDLLMDFLNSILPAHHQIAALTFQNVEVLPDTSDERKAFFDIHCQSVTGERFIVEMQKAKVKYFKDRSLYYITYPIREQAQRGDWNFELTPIYFIAVLDFYYDRDPKTAKFLRNITLKDQDNDPFYEKLQLTYLQMPAFDKQPHELQSQNDKWAYFLKNLENLNDIPQILNEPIFSHAFHTAQLANLDAKQREEYEKSRLSYIGAKEIANTAKDEGRKEGIVEGLAKGRAEAKAEAEAQARAKEKQMILNLSNNGVPLAVIALSVNKTEAEVQKIIEENAL